MCAIIFMCVCIVLLFYKNEIVLKYAFLFYSAHYKYLSKPK